MKILSFAEILKLCEMEARKIGIQVKITILNKDKANIDPIPFQISELENKINYLKNRKISKNEIKIEIQKPDDTDFKEITFDELKRQFKIHKAEEGHSYLPHEKLLYKKVN